MGTCYECMSDAELKDLVIFVDESDCWRLGCLKCVKPKVIVSVGTRLLKEIDKDD